MYNKKNYNKRDQSRNKRLAEQEKRVCHFCANNLSEIDYKNIELLKKFTSNYMKILPRKRMGTCSKHQRKLAQAVKRARHMALIPFTNR